MDEQEVERIAILMHEAFRAHRKRVKPDGAQAGDFAEQSAAQKDSLRAVARAVINDRLGTPSGDEYAPHHIVNAGAGQ